MLVALGLGLKLLLYLFDELVVGYETLSLFFDVFGLEIRQETQHLDYFALADLLLEAEFDLRSQGIRLD